MKESQNNKKINNKIKIKINPVKLKAKRKNNQSCIFLYINLIISYSVS